MQAPPSEDVEEKQTDYAKQIQIQQKGRDGQNTGQNAGIQYQEVSYRKLRITERIPDNPDSLELVEFDAALDNMMSLGIADPAYKSKEYAFAVFYNHITLESIDILRAQYDRWQISTPVFIIDTIYQNAHVAMAESRRLEEVLRLFFEGNDWKAPLQMKYLDEVVKCNIEIEQNGGEIPESWAECPDGPNCPYCNGKEE